MDNPHYHTAGRKGDSIADWPRLLYMGVVTMLRSNRTENEQDARAMLTYLNTYDFLAQMDEQTKLGWCRYAVSHKMKSTQFCRLVWYLGIRAVAGIDDNVGILIDAMTGAPMTSDYVSNELPF